MNTPSTDNAWRQRAQAMTRLVERQAIQVRERQAQEWTMSNGLLTGGRDADSYRLRREQIQQTQQQIERLRQQQQGQRYGY